MKPQLNDCEAERMLENGEYIWSDTRKGYVRARRKGNRPPITAGASLTLSV